MVGVDCSYRQIRIAKVNFRALKGAEFLVSEASCLGFVDGSFDAVTSFDVIEHVVDDDEFLSEVYRVLKPGGFFLITTPNRLRLSNIIRKKEYPYVIGRDPSTGEDLVHVREYTRQELENKLRSCGFDVEKIASSFLGISFYKGHVSVGLPAPILQRFCFELIAKARKPC